MIGIDVKSTFDQKPILAAADRASVKTLPQLAFKIRKTAQGLFERSPEPSPAGSPPHTRKGRLPKSILYAGDKEEQLIGPAFSLAGTSGEPHEFGREYKGEQFDERPFMLPSLEMNQDSFASDWAGSYG